MKLSYTPYTPSSLVCKNFILAFSFNNLSKRCHSQPRLGKRKNAQSPAPEYLTTCISINSGLNQNFEI